MMWFKRKNSPLCRIKDINAETNTLIVHCRGTDALLKLSFEEAIEDTSLIANLSPIHASWVGYYAGMRGLVNNLDIQPPSGTYNIVMINRQGEIIFTGEDKMYTMTPLAAAKQKNIIKKFNSPQACYIGLLAGIQFAKRQSC